jgi:cytochrome c oxidase subunit 4
MSQEHQVAGEHSAEVHTGHPTPLTYVKVAITLSALTAAEFGIFYISWIGHAIIPILTLLSAAKFVLVAMFYMHLRYDRVAIGIFGKNVPIFSLLFVAGLVVASGVVFALMGLLAFFTGGK